LNTSKSGCTLALGSPFDYRSSTLLYLVTDINQPRHDR
jgi:Rad3-related DNA helicase